MLPGAGHKVLLFSTMTTALDSIEELLEHRGWQFSRLDGTTRPADREAAVARFRSSPECGVFLISVRAGGVGLNLQAADTVVFFDSDWNPQQELQAEARAHRQGQTRPVLVLRLFLPRTIEEHIMRSAAAKRVMAEAAITGGLFDGKSSSAERQAFLLDLVRQSAADVSDGGVCSQLTLADLDEQLARSPEELRAFGRVSAAEGVLQLASEADSKELVATAHAASAPHLESDVPTGRGVRRGAAKV